MGIELGSSGRAEGPLKRSTISPDHPVSRYLTILSEVDGGYGFPSVSFLKHLKLWFHYRFLTGAGTPALPAPLLPARNPNISNSKWTVSDCLLALNPVLRQPGLPAFGSKCSFFCFVVLEECHGTLELLVAGKV